MTLSTITTQGPALRINSRANILLKVFLEYGILILRGRKTDQAYEDTGVLGRIFSLLKAENEVYECFDYTLLDLHKKGRRHSKITVIIRDNLFYQMNFKMVPDESLENFRISLNPDNASELKRFFVRQTHILITVAEGEENKDLQLLMKKQLEQNDLGHMKVPLTDLYRSGVEREDSPHAFVYGVKKQVS